LWLLPSLAVGLAFALEFVVRSVRRTVPPITPLLSVGVVILAGIVVALKVDDAPRYAGSGARSAHQFVEERGGDRDLIISLPNNWHYAAEPGVPVDVRPTPDHAVGFSARLLDPRVWELSGPTAWDGSVEQLRPRLTGDPKVFVLRGFVGFGDQMLSRAEAALASLGYEERPGLQANVFGVSVWERPSD
jgi:hypothetical protein